MEDFLNIPIEQGNQIGTTSCSRTPSLPVFNWFQPTFTGGERTRKRGAKNSDDCLYTSRQRHEIDTYVLCTYMINKVDSWFDGQHHSFLEHTSRSQGPQSWQRTALNTLNKQRARGHADALMYTLLMIPMA